MFGRKPPAGPRGYPILVVLPMLRRDTLGFLQRTAREFGDLVPLPILMNTAFLLNHPSHVEHVLQTNHRNYRKAPMIDRLKPLFGEGLVTAQGEFWAKQRQLIQPAFHRKKIEALVPVMADVSRTHLDQWSSALGKGAEFNLSDDVANLTLETVLRTMFTAGLGSAREEASQALVLANDVITKRVWNLTNVSSYFPTRQNRRFSAAVAMLHGIVERAIADRKLQDSFGDDLLGILLTAALGEKDE